MTPHTGSTHHRDAASHHEQAARHHREAAKYHEAGNHELREMRDGIQQPADRRLALPRRGSGQPQHGD
jgi:hypothetical protein